MLYSIMFVDQTRPVSTDLDKRPAAFGRDETFLSFTVDVHDDSEMNIDTPAVDEVIAVVESVTGQGYDESMFGEDQSHRLGNYDVVVFVTGRSLPPIEDVHPTFMSADEFFAQKDAARAARKH